MNKDITNGKGFHTFRSANDRFDRFGFEVRAFDQVVGSRHILRVMLVVMELQRTCRDKWLQSCVFVWQWMENRALSH